MTAEETTKLDPAEAATLYATHAEGLSRFLLGVLREESAAQDVLHTTFARLLEQGHLADRNRIKAWLYQVAFREALVLKRKSKTSVTHQQAVWQLASSQQAASLANSLTGPLPLIHQEKIDAVRQAIASLPREQQEILRQRIYENKTFAVISEELNIPLGTALARMHTALKKLKKLLEDHASE